jgi:hypothetical protein
LFPMSSQHVPQVPNEFLHMFETAPHLIPYPLPLSSTFVTYFSNQKEENTTYLYVHPFLCQRCFVGHLKAQAFPRLSHPFLPLVSIKGDKNRGWVMK